MVGVKMPSRRLSESFVKGVVYNVRHRWPDDTKQYSDLAIACMYDDFSFSDDFGNNDEKFPSWFAKLPEYEQETANPVAIKGGWLIAYEQ